MGCKQVNEGYTNTTRVEIPTKILQRLIRSGALLASECKCLDNNTRKVLWLSLLNASCDG